MKIRQAGCGSDEGDQTNDEKNLKPRKSRRENAKSETTDERPYDGQHRPRNFPNDWDTVISELHQSFLTQRLSAPISSREGAPDCTIGFRITKEISPHSRDEIGVPRLVLPYVGLRFPGGMSSPVNLPGVVAEVGFQPSAF